MTKASEIVGLVPGIKNLENYRHDSRTLAKHEGFNDAISQISDVELEVVISEEKLYEIIIKTYRQNGNSAGCIKAYLRSIISAQDQFASIRVVK